MCYKTIVVHVDHSLHAEARMRYAAQLAARCGAHLIGSAFSGISRYAEAGMTMILAQQHERRSDHDSALARFDAIAAAAGVASHERRYGASSATFAPGPTRLKEFDLHQTCREWQGRHARQASRSRDF